MPNKIGPRGGACCSSEENQRPKMKRREPAGVEIWPDMNLLAATRIKATPTQEKKNLERKIGQR
jgi:hypothetical protein